MHNKVLVTCEVIRSWFSLGAMSLKKIIGVSPHQNIVIHGKLYIILNIIYNYIHDNRFELC